MVLSTVLIAVPVEARKAMAAPVQSPLSGYIGARAASLAGDHAESARRYIALLGIDPGNPMLARNAISESIRAGRPVEALAVAAKRPLATLGADGRLLLAADALKRRDGARALQILRASDTDIDLSFIAPISEAWLAADRADPKALDILARIPAGSASAPLLSENRALILLKLGRATEADPFARRAIASGSGREDRIRLAMAQGFVRTHDPDRALQMLGGTSQPLAAARAALASGRFGAGAVDTPAKAFAQTLAALAIELNRDESRGLALALVQVARFADPEDGELPVLAGLLLDADGQLPEALAAFRSVSPADLFIGEARDALARSLVRADRAAEALQMAQPVARAPEAVADDWSRLGDVYSALELHGQAADAYGRAIAKVAAGGSGPALWQLRLLQGSALDQAGEWPAARNALEQAASLAPDQPLVLNYLGYAKLEKGEDLDRAEELIRKASTLAPQDASITDSLGWAQFKRGRIDDAIVTLEKAAVADSSQAEIREHLGDALYTAGRRFEARYAWSAALVTADGRGERRLRAKLDLGLTPANAAP